MLLPSEQFSLLASLYFNSDPEDFLQCLRSIEGQTLQPDQIVIVLDGPINPGVRDLLTSFSARLPIEIVPSQHNLGLGKALALGLESCKHELVARVDTDDISVKNRFEKQVSFMRSHREIAALGGVMRERYLHLGKIRIRDRSGSQGAEEIKRLIRKRNPLNHPTVMFRKSAVRTVGGYLDCRFFEDYYLWIRLVHAGYKIANLDSVLVETEIDDKFFLRRGGVDYLRAEKEFLVKLWQGKLIDIKHLILWILLRAPLRVMPLAMRKIIYMSFLRG